jgi:hypothetical protein
MPELKSHKVTWTGFLNPTKDAVDSIKVFWEHVSWSCGIDIPCFLSFHFGHTLPIASFRGYSQSNLSHSYVPTLQRRLSIISGVGLPWFDSRANVACLPERRFDRVGTSFKNIQYRVVNGWKWRQSPGFSPIVGSFPFDGSQGTQTPRSNR